MLAYLTCPLLTLFARRLAYRLYSDNYNVEAVTSCYLGSRPPQSVDTTLINFTIDLVYKSDAP